MPLSAEMPAPVRTVIEFAAAIAFAIVAGSDFIRVILSDSRPIRDTMRRRASKGNARLPETLSYTSARRDYTSPNPMDSFGLAYLAMLALANAALGTYLFRELWRIPPGRHVRPTELTMVVAMIGSVLTVAALGGSLAILAINWRYLRGWLLTIACAGFAFVPFAMFRLLLCYVCWKHALVIAR